MKFIFLELGALIKYTSPFLNVKMWSWEGLATSLNSNRRIQNLNPVLIPFWAILPGLPVLVTSGPKLEKVDIRAAQFSEHHPLALGSRKAKGRHLCRAPWHCPRILLCGLHQPGEGRPRSPCP